MSDNRVFDVPKCKVKYVESCNALSSSLFTPHGAYTGPRYRVLLVDGGNEYLAGEYPVSEFAAAISTAHRIAKRAQTTRFRNNVAILITAMASTKE